jgi:hypothetical protein
MSDKMKEGTERFMKTHGFILDGAEPCIPIVYSIGRLIVTCGCLEMQSYVWIEGFSPGEKEKWRDKKHLFEARRKRVVEIVKGLAIDPLLISCAQTVWGDAKKEMEYRNIVAHSPVIYKYNGPDAETPHFIKIPDIKSFAEGDLNDYTQKEIDEATERVHDVNKRLENVRRLIESSIGIEINIDYREDLPTNGGLNTT